MVSLTTYLLGVICAYAAYKLYSRLSTHPVNANALYPSYAAEEVKISPAGYSMLQVLQARQPTNLRLETAFGFTTSTFVSASPAIHGEFVRCATSMLQRARDWSALRNMALAAARRFAPDAPSAFDAYIQAVTLSTILCTVLSDNAHPVRLDNLAREDLIRVGAGITRLWTHSKTATRGAPALPDELHVVNTLVRRWLTRRNPFVPRDSAAWTIDADENPLEFIVPAFETLWRVVALAFAEAHGNAARTRPFVALAAAKDITPASFKAGVEGFVHEVLRLYPPTRRIERVWDGGSVKGDVERAQRDPRIWGPTAEVFDPNRTIVPQLLAFGAKPLKCPGAVWAPQAAGIIVAALLSADLKLTRGERLGGRDGWDGWEIGV